MRVIGRLIAMLIANLATLVNAQQLDWVSFNTPTGENVRALFGTPLGAGPFPAVVFNHGTGVRERGYEGAVADANMDVADYVRAFNQAGYAAIAPIRAHERGSAGRERGEVFGREDAWKRVIRGGVAVSRGAYEHLASLASIDPARVGIVGFSEGGLVTLWALIEQIPFAAGVLMSPATIRTAGPMQLKQAVRSGAINHISVPVLLTLGENDNRSIRKISKKHLIPGLSDLNIAFTHKRYAGLDHSAFYDIRSRHFADVTGFLDTHLKAP